MLNIILAILVFGLIVLIHEFGHFLLAKMNGIGVVEFSIGMGPRLFSIQGEETQYSIKALPFGGSCMMLGEDGSESDPKAFNNKSVLARISVIFAGPFFNFILAFIFAVIIIATLGHDTAYVYDTLEGTPAREAGLENGDIIKKINGKTIVGKNDVILYVAAHPGEPLDVTYLRPEGGTSLEGSAPEGKKGIIPYAKGQMYTTTIVPEYSEENGGYKMGVSFYGYYEKPENFLELMGYSVNQIQFCIRSTFDSLKLLFTGQVKADEAVAGPVRIVSMIGESVGENREYGLTSTLLTLSNWCLILSATLGIMNLLPIPALDGGRLVFLVLEGLRGKPIDREKEGMVHLAGFAVLMVLMVVVLFNDIRSFF